jgi:hypothetical protein
VVDWLATGTIVTGDDDATGEFPDVAGLDPDSPPTPSTAAQVPVKDPELSATADFTVTSAEGPGSGNWTSLPSTVVQPLPRFATKRSGRLEKATAGAERVPDAAVISTEAQVI